MGGNITLSVGSGKGAVSGGAAIITGGMSKSAMGGDILLYGG